MTTTAYDDRQVDVLLLYDEPDSRRGQQSVRLAAGGDGGLAVAGVRRIAQALVLELLTERGSVRHLPARGTNFLRSLRQGNVTSPADLQLVVRREVAAAAANLKQREQPGDPPDEKLQRIVVVEVSTAPTTAKIALRVESQAGDSREVIVPLPLPLGGRA